MTKVPQTRGRKTKQNPSKTAIAKVLREAVFDPREPGPLKVVADVGDPAYYVNRAVEMLATVQRGMHDDCVQAHQDIKNAMALLALAVVVSSDDN